MICKYVIWVIELDNTISASGFLGHIWFGCPLRYSKEDRKWPKIVKNDHFYHTPKDPLSLSVGLVTIYRVRDRDPRISGRKGRAREGGVIPGRRSSSLCLAPPPPSPVGVWRRGRTTIIFRIFAYLSDICFGLRSNLMPVFGYIPGFLRRYFERASRFLDSNCSKICVSYFLVIKYSQTSFVFGYYVHLMRSFNAFI